MDEVVGMTSILDEKMIDVFDWSTSELPVRDAIWNHFMDADTHNTDKTATKMAPYMKMDDDKLKRAVEVLLKS